MPTIEDEWIWGWDPTPGIVSVWAEPDGRAFVWRRLPEGAVVRDNARFRPWVVLASLEDLAHLGARLAPEDAGAPRSIGYRELDGPGALRYVVHADDMATLSSAILQGASRRLGRPLGHLRDLGAAELLVLAPEDQYLIATGRTYFRGLAFDDLRRLQLDLETTGLDATRDQIFLIAVRDPDGRTQLLEARGDQPRDEADLIAQLVDRVRACDPDVIENHNLHGFDLPFLERRARVLGVPLALGRAGLPGLRPRPARRGVVSPHNPQRRIRYTVPGRELIDTLDAVLRHDFATRDLPGHGLKAVARHLGIPGGEPHAGAATSPQHDPATNPRHDPATNPRHDPATNPRHDATAPERAPREYIPGARVYDVWLRDPDRVRRYAADDVAEVAGLARLFGGAAFALAGMAPRRYERLADAGAATGVIDPMLVRAYLRSGAALPAHQAGDGTSHSGAALHLFAAGVAQRIVKADVASLYPSLMREYRIGPARDRLGAMLAIVDRLVDHRLAAKATGRAARAGSRERHAAEAMSAAMKLVINSAYGYLGAVGLTRFADVHAANRVTQHGRAVLALLCRELAARGTALLEADTDGVYFAVPAHWSEADEQRVVAEVARLLPARVQLELDGRYAAMLSHEPKNYALLRYDADGAPPVIRADDPRAIDRLLVMRGVAFRSSRAEPFGERFLREALVHLLTGDLVGVQRVYVATVMALRKRELPTRDVAARVKLTTAPAAYLAARGTRQQHTYEAVLASGRSTWSIGERVRVYRATRGRGRLFIDLDDEEVDAASDVDGDDAGEPRSTDERNPAEPRSTDVRSTTGRVSTSAMPGRAPGERGGPRSSADPARSDDPRDYDVEHYLRVLHNTYAARFARALAPEDFATVFADPEQPSLFPRSLVDARPILTTITDQAEEVDSDPH